MRRLLLSFILICLLTIPASAHSGKTDSSGGHYDHDTGDYHYHHGYSAHDHYDMDGDGDLDCPYDFDDQTDRSSGTASSTYSPSSTTESDYRRGYEAGKDAGYDDGFDDGKTFGQTAAEKRGYDKGHADGYSSGYSKARLFGICAVAIVVLIAWLLLRWKNRELSDVRIDHARQLRSRDKLLQERELAIAALQKRLADSEAEHRAQIKRLSESAAPPDPKEVERVQAQSRLLDYIRRRDPLGRAKIAFPPELRITDDDRLYWGELASDKPHGDATVYVTPYGGQCWHCRRGCSGSTQPMFVFEAMRKHRPCGRCVPAPYRTLQVPEWYREFQRASRGEYDLRQLSAFDEEDD